MYSLLTKFRLGSTRRIQLFYSKLRKEFNFVLLDKSKRASRFYKKKKKKVNLFDIPLLRYIFEERKITNCISKNFKYSVRFCWNTILCKVLDNLIFFIHTSFFSCLNFFTLDWGKFFFCSSSNYLRIIIWGRYRYTYTFVYFCVSNEILFDETYIY